MRLQYGWGIGQQNRDGVPPPQTGAHECRSKTPRTRIKFRVRMPASAVNNRGHIREGKSGAPEKGEWRQRLKICCRAMEIEIVSGDDRCLVQLGRRSRFRRNSPVFRPPSGRWSRCGGRPCWRDPRRPHFSCRNLCDRFLVWPCSARAGLPRRSSRSERRRVFSVSTLACSLRHMRFIPRPMRNYTGSKRI